MRKGEAGGILRYVGSADISPKRTVNDLMMIAEACRTLGLTDRDIFENKTDLVQYLNNIGASAMREAGRIALRPDENMMHYQVLMEKMQDAVMAKIRVPVDPMVPMFKEEFFKQPSPPPRPSFAAGDFTPKARPAPPSVGITATEANEFLRSLPEKALA